MIDSIQSVLERYSSKSTYGNRDLSAFLKISMKWDSIVGKTLYNIKQPQ